ncbi:HAMP domain-containing sensor histidine kinase [Acinetobacter gerneri]|uniref:histidine kinase n=1 Tax=Acinetobacter gerneri TaxID=202952 RepID=A0AAW8JGP4_9GAMM|nr:HAMP domain-containing sensor histidine kinase [Acinetobacter gerneri]MDQ9009299.1 HAMP domain-containing sensor histidine kinase [Acinetobacter gerneri]MDQ9013499.1 HAMP domain-containing sensor histidine kinase [Acinetobacter gerneri]MDQ9024781.1 HAMP domain-containing sensor histidine kinase [Acinetobacter gerneri]MDQ9052171.1 HAMP domain-containing sensor histidine kinase [Acinetobacter gerneri]MDQ9059474.1 HAMP domain-containing sensor histidine kinase [Acinetobacter gerneri]
MKLNLIDLKDAEQLSACPTAILLDVFTPDNELEGFLKLARGILKTENAILAFDDEPYIWFDHADQFHAMHKSIKSKYIDQQNFFEQTLVIDQGNPNYTHFSDYVKTLGVHHGRIVSFDLRQKKHSLSYGRVTFFDQNNTYFQDQDVALVAEFIQQIVKFIALKFENSILNEQFEQQIAINKSKTKFFQIIAHDLRAPFHGLLGFSEVLAEESDTLEQKDVLQISEYLHDTAQSTYNLLENLLNWAMAEDGQFVYHPIRFRLSQVLEIVYKILNPLAIKKNIKLSLDISEQFYVIADINMVTSVIQNLVSNALKFTHVDGTGVVELKARQKDHHIEIMIRDSGLGMSGQQVKNLFKHNIKVSQKGTSGEKGTGLGLVLCQHFLDLNHGKIDVESEIGVGTTFIVSLPSASTHTDYEI